MGDFLSNLTARTFQPTDSVQPRLPSRFEVAPHLAVLEEPTAPAPWARVNEIAGETDDDLSASPSVPASPARLPDMQSSRRRFAKPLLADAAIDTAGSVPAEKTKTTTVPLLATLLQGERAPDLLIRNQDETMHMPTDARHPSQAESPAERLSHAPTAAPNNHMPRVADRPRAALALVPTTAMPLLQQRLPPPTANITPRVIEPDYFVPVPTTITPRPASHALPAIGPNQANAGLEDEPTLPTQPSSPSALPEMLSQPSRAGLLTPPIARRASPLTAPTPGSEPTSSVPTINVTIGRIEVRATPAPAPAAKPAAAKTATLSLDDYLRRRSTGGAQ